MDLGSLNHKMEDMAYPPKALPVQPSYDTRYVRATERRKLLSDFQLSCRGSLTRFSTLHFTVVVGQQALTAYSRSLESNV